MIKETRKFHFFEKFLILRVYEWNLITKMSEGKTFIVWHLKCFYSRQNLNRSIMNLFQKTFLRTTTCFAIFALAITMTSVFAQQENTASAKESKQFNVRDFGAKGDGNHDDSEAIHAAIDAASKKGPNTVLFFPKGKYVLSHQTGIRHSCYQGLPLAEGIKPQELDSKIHANLILQNLSNLTLLGEEGTLFLFHSTNDDGVLIDHCKNVTLKNLSFDYDPLPFTQGVIDSFDKKTIRFTLEEGYSDPTKGYFANVPGKKLLLFFGSKGEFNRNASDKFAETVKSLGNNLFEITLLPNEDDTGLVKGERISYIPRAQFFGVIAWNSEKCVFDHVNLYSSPMMGMKSHQCAEMTYRNCFIGRMPGTTRLVITAADGINSTGDRKGPIIEGCTVNHTCDDCISFNNNQDLILSSPDANHFLIDTGKNVYHVGDRVTVWDFQTGNNRGEAKVKELKVIKLNKHVALEVTTDQPISNVVVFGSPGAEPHELRQRGGHESPKGNVGQPGDVLTNLDSCGADFVIRNNIIGSNRARGILIQSQRGVIEGNHLVNIGNTALKIGIEASGHETIPCEDILIQGNHFEHLQCGPAIGICDWQHEESQAINHKNIIIKNNEFNDCLAKIPLILINNTGSLKVAENRVANIENREKTSTLEKVMREITASFGVKELPSHTFIFLNLCEKIEVKDNQVPTSDKSIEWVGFGPKVDRKQVIVEGNKTTE
jgi:hypothetical protein